MDNRVRDASFGSDRLDILTRIEMEERGSVDSRMGMFSPLLLPHPDDEYLSDSEGMVSPRLNGGIDYVGQNLRMVMISRSCIWRKAVLLYNFLFPQLDLNRHPSSLIVLLCFFLLRRRCTF